MKNYAKRLYTSLFTSVTLFLFVTLTLAACSGPGGSNGSASTPTVSTTTTAEKATVTPTTTPQIQLGTQPCPDAVKAPSYWDAIIPTQANVNKVESVLCGNLVGNTSLQALVTVRANGTGAILDIYVYNHITDPNPAQIFKLQNLYKGDARISGYNTVLTAEVDQASSVNKNSTSNAALVQDLFREFKWSDGAGTLVPVTFPGIFPDLTRYQAEAAQQEVNQGHQPWRLSATQTAQALATSTNLLKWNANSPATIVSGGGQHDVDAVVSVKNTLAVSGTITITLSRLEGNSNGGIWEAISVTSNGMSITSPKERNRLSSPTAVAGSGNAFEGVIGRVFVLDHLYTNIGQADARGATGNGNTTFSTTVSYTSTFKNGTEEGVLVLYSYSNANGSIAGAVMIKEMLG
jgi:Immunoglobulin-like domain of bacterial spore germination